MQTMTTLLIVGLSSCLCTASAQVREPAGAEPGTAVLTGTVRSDDGKPLAQILVTVTSSTLIWPRTALTNDAGRYEMGDLPPGDARVYASNHGYAKSSSGSSRTLQDGVPVQLERGQTTQADIVLMRTGIIDGVISDVSGHGLAGLLVFALDPQEASFIPARFGGESAMHQTTTDVLGRYRLFDLPPGDYFIVAFAPKGDGSAPVERVSSSEIDERLAALRTSSSGFAPSTGLPSPKSASRREVIAPILFPGTPHRLLAVPVQVAPGQERDNINFSVSAVSVSDMSGTIVSSIGPVSNIQVSIIGEDSIGAFGLPSASPVLTNGPNANGQFKYTNVVAGSYRLIAKGLVVGNHEPVFGSVDLQVGAQDVSSVLIQLGPVPEITGRMVTDSVGAPIDPTKYKVGLSPVVTAPTGVINQTLVGNAFALGRPVTPLPDGTFNLGRVPPGQYQFHISAPSERGEWWPRTALYNGRDLLDTTLDVSSESGSIAIAVMMSSRHTRISGTLKTEDGIGTRDYWVMLYPADRSLWTPDSRRIRTTKTDQKGAFSFSSLPDGRYLLAALTDLGSDRSPSNDLLSQITPYAVSVVIAGEKDVVQDLIIRK